MDRNQYYRDDSNLSSSSEPKSLARFAKLRNVLFAITRPNYDAFRPCHPSTDQVNHRSVKGRTTAATPEPISILNSHLKIALGPLSRAPISKRHGPRKGKGYENHETEGNSTRFVLFDDEEGKTIRRAEKSGRDKNCFVEKGADADLSLSFSFYFPRVFCGRGVRFGFRSEPGLCRTSAQRSIVRSSNIPSTLLHLGSLRL